MVLKRFPSITIPLILVAAAFLLQGCLDSSPTDGNEQDFAASQVLVSDENGTQPMFGRLGLTDEQIAEIKALHEAYVQSLRDQRDELLALSAEERVDQLNAMRAALRDAITAVFTEEQLARLEELRKKSGEFAGRGGHGKRDHDFDATEMINKRLEHITEELGLTDDQQQYVREVLEGVAAAMEALDRDSMEPFELRQARRDIGGLARDQIVLILTDEQMNTFAELRDERPRGRGRGRR